MNKTGTMFSALRAFRIMAVVSLLVGMLTVIFAVVAYLPTSPQFSIFNTFLSDIGDTAGWPQIIFNNGTILAAPLRVIVVALLLFVLRDFEDRRSWFEGLVLFIAFFSAFGTVCMTAVPYSIGPAVHKAGIGLYFMGTVFLQGFLGFKVLKIKALPRILPALSFFIVFCFVVFLAFYMLLQSGADVRALSVFWEWMCFFSSMLWLLGNAVFLKDE